MSSLIKHAIASVSALIFCLIFYLDSLKLPDTAARLPQVLIGLITLLAIAMFIESFIKYKKSNTEGDDQVEKEKIAVKRVILFVTLIALYIFLMDVVGYFVVTPLFVFAVFIYLKAAKIKTISLVAIGFTTFVYVFFVMFLKIPIPMGILPL